MSKMSELQVQVKEAKVVETKQYWLHFIGSRVYGQDNFTFEAKRLGAQRAIASAILRQIKWGEKLLIATWIPQERSTSEWKRFNKGTGSIFGYMQVTRVVPLFSEKQEEFMKALMSEMHVVRADYSDAGASVERMCGSYTTGASFFVTDTIEEIVDAAVEIAKSAYVKVRFFVAGAFYDMPNGMLELPNINFTRGYTRVNIPSIEALEKIEMEEIRVQSISNYGRRAYVKKEDKKRLLSDASKQEVLPQ